MEIIAPAHILVTKGGAKQIDESSINYKDSKLLHLAFYRNHFVPILSEILEERAPQLSVKEANPSAQSLEAQPQKRLAK